MLFVVLYMIVLLDVERLKFLMWLNEPVKMIQVIAVK